MTTAGSPVKGKAMKNKDVILDFTSLLDIVLIILFFFILFSAFNVEKTGKQYEDKLTALEAEREGLREEQSRIQTEEARLQAEWDRVRTLDENAVRNQEALITFDKGGMLCFNLRKEDDSEAWKLSATRKESSSGEEETVGTILPGDDLTASINRIFAEAGYREDEVLLVTFTYNGNVIGTHRLYVEIMKAFRDIQAVRKNLYLSTINISK